MAGKAGTYYVAAGALGDREGTYKLSVREYVDDYPADMATTGSVSVGGSVSGEIEFGGYPGWGDRLKDSDRDWFAVELEAGTRYRIDLEGSHTDRGTLQDTFLRRVVNSEGEYQPGTNNDDYAGSPNSRVYFTPGESGTYYIEASGDWDQTGIYTLSVVEDSI